MNKETIIAELKKLKPVLSEKYSVHDIALFGSYSKNEAPVKSDIVILIHF
ncbi:MAG: nucleotidyltransferase domain-containing protein [Ferruginibacter sp.]